MSRLLFAALASLDGYMADEDGNFDWAEPDGEEHQFVNDLQRDVGLHLYGRRMYEVLVAWETIELEGEPDWIADFARIGPGADSRAAFRKRRRLPWLPNRPLRSTGWSGPRTRPKRP
jgi:dihydrofolate reductase